MKILVHIFGNKRELGKGLEIGFKLQDFWIGAYWEKDRYRPGVFDIWICITPCFPIHHWSGYAELEEL